MSEEMEPRVQTEEVEEEEFARGGMATIFGAPISWTALFAAICAVTTLIPFYFYVTGGGYVSAASGLFMPLAGQVLGPWAGTIAAFVGGLVGMFIAPGAFPLGLLDVILSGAIFGLSAGLMTRKWRWLFLVWWIINLALIFLYPFRVPGAAGGFAAPEELGYTLSWTYVLLAFIVWVVLGPLTTDLLSKWARRGSSKVMQVISLLLIAYIARSSIQPMWSLPYAHIFQWPPDWVLIDNWVSIPTYVLDWVGTCGLALVVFPALWRARLRQVPGSLVAELSAGVPEEKAARPVWIQVVQIVGVLLILWAAVTLISGLLLADVGPDIEGRSMFFEDTGIPGYGIIAWVGGAIGVVIVVVASLLGKPRKE